MKKILLFSFTSLLPLPVFAETIGSLIEKIKTNILQPFIELLFVIATVVFFWGIITYVVGSYGDETKLKQGKQAMIWGIVGLVIMTSAWAIVKGIEKTLFN